MRPTLATLVSLLFQRRAQPPLKPTQAFLHARRPLPTLQLVLHEPCPHIFQASCCGLFLAVPTAPLEELGLIYDILSVWADPGRVSDPGHVSHPRHVSFPGRAAPGWPLCATHPSLSTGNLQSQCGFFIIIFGAKGDLYVYLLSFLELRVTSMSFIIIFGVKGDRYAFLLL